MDVYVKAQDQPEDTLPVWSAPGGWRRQGGTVNARRKIPDRVSVENASYFARRRVKRTLELAEMYVEDPRMYAPEEAGQCLVCFDVREVWDLQRGYELRQHLRRHPLPGLRHHPQALQALRRRQRDATEASRLQV